MNRLVFSLTLILFTTLVSASETDTNTESTIATVNGDAISLGLFLQTLQEGVRQTFYHGKIPQAEFQKFRHKTLNTLIEEALLDQHAQKIGVLHNEKSVIEALEKEDKRYATHPQWEKNKERVLKSMRMSLEKARRIKALEHQIKTQVVTTEKETLAYYKNHPDKFTTPLQQDIAVIMLKIDPGSGTSGWQAGMKEAENIYQKIMKGEESFSELAKVHSAHASSAKGGELGFIHSGTLAKEVEAKLKTMKEGDISAPIRILQGYSIIKLNRQIAAKLNGYDRVKERAHSLCERDMKEQAWSGLKQQLRAESQININMDEITKINLSQ